MNAASRDVSVVIPAHNEGSGVLALLRALGSGEEEGIELVVVCNGCTDETASQARAAGPHVVVLEVPQPSKRAALERGDALARHPFRAWVDADVVISAGDIRRLVNALNDPVQVVAPARRLVVEHSSVPVRWYYRVWEQLPQVDEGVFGRGVVVMSPSGHSRVTALPGVMSDDLAVSEAFLAHERAVVSEAMVRIVAPLTLRDLLRRRIRVATGAAQLDALGLRTASARTTPRTLARIAVADVGNLPKVAVFAAVSLTARILARRRIRRGDFTTWLRDESSRTLDRPS